MVILRVADFVFSMQSAGVSLPVFVVSSELAAPTVSNRVLRDGVSLTQPVHLRAL